MLFRARRRHLQRAGHTLSVWLLNRVLRIFPDGKNRRIRRVQVTISDLEKNVAGPDSCCVRWTALVNVLEHPSLVAILIEAHERGADRVPPWKGRAFRVAKPCMA